MKVSLPTIGLLRLTDKLHGAYIYRGDMINNALGSKRVWCVWKREIQNDTSARVTITVSHITLLTFLQVAGCPGHAQISTSTHIHTCAQILIHQHTYTLERTYLYIIYTHTYALECTGQYIHTHIHLNAQINTS